MACVALRTHTTLPSLKEDLEKKTTPIIPLSYSISEVSQHLINNAARPLLSKITEAQYEALTHNFQSSKSCKPEELKKDLEAALELFDAAFFFGLLKSHIDLYIKTERYSSKSVEQMPNVMAFFSKPWRSTGEMGSQTPQKLCSDGRRPYIMMWLFHHLYGSQNQGEVDPEVAHEWFGTLLHEMLHAFLAIFSCQCWDVCYAEVKDPVRGTGRTGHGAMFSEALDAIKDSCVREFGLQDVPGYLDIFDISQSVYSEVSRTGWVLTNDQIQRWHLDPDRLKGKMEDWQRNKSKIDHHIRWERIRMQKALAFYKKHPDGVYCEPKQGWIEWLEECWSSPNFFSACRSRFYQMLPLIFSIVYFIVLVHLDIVKLSVGTVALGVMWYILATWISSWIIDLILDKYFR